MVVRAVRSWLLFGAIPAIGMPAAIAKACPLRAAGRDEYSPPFQGGVAAPLIKWSRSLAAQTGRFVTNRPGASRHPALERRGMGAARAFSPRSTTKTILV
jgi:hypothetical protein